MVMEEDGLLEDMKFDAELDAFYTGGGTVNLSPQPTTLGSSLDAGRAPDAGLPQADDGRDGGVSGAAAAMGAAATAAAVTAGAVGTALMGGNFSAASSAIGAMERVSNVAVPTSLKPVKEQAGRFLQKAQPWREFLLPLSIPAASDGCSRLTANVYNFQTNYAILFVVQLALTVIFQPSVAICIIMTVVVWVFFLKKNDDPEWAPSLGGVQLGPMQRWLLMTAVTAVVLLFVAGSAIFNAALLYVVAAFVHGIIHDPAAKGLPGSNSPPVPL